MFDHYRQTYLLSDYAQTFVRSSDRVPKRYRRHLLMGYCNRSFGAILPRDRTNEGGAIRGCLKRYGLLKPSGHELFRGCVVVPSRNKAGHYVSAKGYRTTDRPNRWSSIEVYWRKPKADDFIRLGLSDIKCLIND